MVLLVSPLENVTLYFPFREDSELLFNSEFVLMQLLSRFSTFEHLFREENLLFLCSECHRKTCRHAGIPELVAVKHTYLDFNVTGHARNHTHVPGLRTHTVNTALVKTVC